MKKLYSLGLKFEDNKLLVLDQTLLPHQEKWVDCINPDHMVELIQKLAVRGAPLIGVAAALSIGHFAQQGASIDEILIAAQKLKVARPTAVNLMAAMDRLIFNHNPQNLTAKSIQCEAEKIFEEDAILSQAMSERAQSFINSGDNIITHCNTGGLVTTGSGTALGAIALAHQLGKKIHVFVDETRPLLQGARLTTWELEKLKIPHTLICDNMAGFLMSQGKVNKVFVGADRIAVNGDFANKIGTYSLAVLAHHHKIPFYVVAPRTTYDDKCASGADIPVEQRNADEVRMGKSPANTPVWNPSFDVTPRQLISGIVFDDGML
jgi:methylthioribose-1-phosphate isomerase